MMPATEMRPATLLTRPALPQLTRFVHAAPMPHYVKEQILDAALAREIDRLKSRPQRSQAVPPEAAPVLPEPVPALAEPVLTLPQAGPVLPDDPKVREVLENGGFTWLGYTRRGQEVWEYERVSRDGQPLTGQEADSPPKYKVTSWGSLACFCDCPYRTKPGAPDKHVEALTFVLMQTSPNVVQTSPNVVQNGPHGTGQDERRMTRDER